MRTAMLLSRANVHPRLKRTLVASSRRPYTMLSPARFRQAPVAAVTVPTMRMAVPLLSREPPSSGLSASTYELLLQRLYQVNRFTNVELGLENMQRLNEAFGDPASRCPVIHIAGTNGKGSVAFKLANALQQSGYRAGLFVSPHVACFRERIQVNGELISEAQVCDHLGGIFNISAQLRIPATFFEITTMLAFRHFAKQHVDCIVLETGLGGRLDATNIVTPALSVITSIGMDHAHILGNSVEAIAREKAGIIKTKAPVIVGPQAPIQVIQKRAHELGAPVIQVPSKEDFEGNYNAENTAIAREVCVQLNQLPSTATKENPYIDLMNARVQAALKSRPPCRFQVLHVLRPNSSEKKVTLVLDVAHNPAAMKRLASSLRRRFPTQRLRAVGGFSADKDIHQLLDTILAMCDNDRSRIHLVRADHARAASLEEVNLALAPSNEKVDAADRSIPAFTTITSVDEGVQDAMAMARSAEHEEVVVVCGSVFLMAEARHLLGFKEPTDSPAINAVDGLHLATPEGRLLRNARLSQAA